LPSGLKATLFTSSYSPTSGGWTSRWVATFHSLTVPSNPPDASMRPFGLNAKAVMSLGPNSGGPSWRWLLTSHRRIVSSALADASIRPSAL
jgi:hypothetical protein